MIEQPSPYRCILDRKFIIENICITCSQNGKCDYQSIYPVPACATVDTVERYFETLHSDSCASHSAFSTPSERTAPENECFCVSKCDPKNCGTAFCKCSECWNPATSLGCDGNWQTAHNAAIAQAAREEVLDKLIPFLPKEHLTRLDGVFGMFQLKEYAESLRQSDQKNEGAS